MNRKIAGLLMAVAAVGTSLIVLLRAEKPRRFLQARVEQVRGALPEPEQVRQSAQQVATHVSHLANNAKGTTQQAMNKVKQTGSDLAEKTKQLTPVGSQKVKQTGSDLAEKAKQLTSVGSRNGR